ncbi:MAG: homoserine dehydrogenase [Thermoleophilaceae bacterium]|nr:homoserine dehydrogenase [Thermoleophilaceae bacterium]
MGDGEAIKIGLLGRGTVGGAFALLVEQRADAIARLTGKRPSIGGVLTSSTGDFDQILEDSDVIVELIGGLDPARDYVLRALKAGKPVISANKALVSTHGAELFAASAESGAPLFFEAAVAGVIPAIRVIEESLAGAHVERVHGIVNGTTNYILTEMANSGLSYDEALKQAQDLGYAEADPTADVGGGDAAAKMAILARLAFGLDVSFDQVVFEGIENITSEDIAYAREFDLVLKLVGTAERINGGISVRVFPAFLYPSHPLASVHGSFNAVTVESPAITEITMSGPGAGGVQTASAVLGDLVSILSGVPRTRGEAAPATIVDDVKSAFYLHLEVEDRPGVLAEVAAALGNHDVSVRNFNQQGTPDAARLVMVMHPTLESNFFAAVAEIAALPFVGAAPRAIRVIEEEFGS